MLIILPNGNDGVEELAERLTGRRISDIINTLENTGSSPVVSLSLPKFKLQTTLQLGSTLQKVGSVS
jgi:serine protease inhibitor